MSSRPTRLRHDASPLAAATLATATAAAPWMFGFDASRAAVASHIAFTMTFASIAILVCALPAAAMATAGGGVWLAASPWVLGYAQLGVPAWSSDLIAGVLLAAIGLLSYRNRTTAAPAAGPEEPA
jgi:hypothetical protein